MNTHRPMFPTGAVVASAVLLASLSTGLAGPKQPKSSPPQYEFRITGGISTAPDHTAENGFDQCRENGLGDTSIVQRKTNLDLSELGLGPVRKVTILDFGASSAPQGTAATFSFWLTKNCQIITEGFISSGAWPLASGEELTVLIPEGTPWFFNKVGGGSADCSGAPTLNPDGDESTTDGDVLITVRRNDARDSNVCDCPFDYSDDEAVDCP